MRMISLHLIILCLFQSSSYYIFHYQYNYKQKLILDVCNVTGITSEGSPISKLVCGSDHVKGCYPMSTLIKMGYSDTYFTLPWNGSYHWRYNESRFCLCSPSFLSVERVCIPERKLERQIFLDEVGLLSLVTIGLTIVYLCYLVYKKYKDPSDKERLSESQYRNQCVGQKILEMGLIFLILVMDGYWIYILIDMSNYISRYKK